MDLYMSVTPHPGSVNFRMRLRTRALKCAIKSSGRKATRRGGGAGTSINTNHCFSAMFGVKRIIGTETNHKQACGTRVNLQRIAITQQPNPQNWSNVPLRTAAKRATLSAIYLVALDPH